MRQWLEHHEINLAGTEVAECDDNTSDGATIATLPIHNARKGMIKPVGYKGSSAWRARSKATPRGDTRAAAVMCDVAWHDVGSRWSCGYVAVVHDVYGARE